MSKPAKMDVWYPFYVGDYRKKTARLSCEQHGAYRQLIDEYWISGALPDDDAVLARIVGLELRHWRKHRPHIASFFIIADGRWVHNRVEEELERAREIVEKRRQAGQKGGRPKKQMLSTEKANGSILLSENGVFKKQNETPTRVTVDGSEIVPLPIQEEGLDSQVSSMASIVPFVRGATK